MNRVELGKIKKLTVGIGGYQDAQLGVSVELGGSGWGVCDFFGTWATHTERCKWTPAEQRGILADTMLRIRDLLADANVATTDKLIGKPIEATFDGGILKSWRILKEVL